jgi:phage head maturation protease
MTVDTQVLTPEEIEAMQVGQVPPGAGHIGLIETRTSATIGGVDFAERVITVLAVPYEQPTPVPFQRDVWNEVFSRSAFNGLDAVTRRVPATACLDVPDHGHSGGKLVGRAQAFVLDRPEGLIGELKISRTAAGDETLELANDGSLGVSVGFMVKNRLDESLDRMSKTRRINRAFLDHIAFVADKPAYPGAQVLAVRTEGGEDPNPSATPYIDDFLSDPIFQQANERLNR